MKADIHPTYVDTTVTCTCGNTFTTRSTNKSGSQSKRCVRTKWRNSSPTEVSRAATRVVSGERFMGASPIDLR